MRKFQHKVWVWGTTGVQTKAHHVSYAPVLDSVACKHAFTSKVSARHAFFGGALSLNLFPSLHDVMSKLEPDGVRADWDKIGCDLRAAMDRIDAKSGKEAA